MAVPVEFPRALLRERDSRLELSRRVISPGVGGSGVMPLIATDGGGLWEMALGAVVLNSADLIRMWEALAARSDGGVTPFVVPWCGCLENPVVTGPDGKPISQAPVPFSDPVFFSDGTGFTSPSVVTSVSGVWPLRSTTLRFVTYSGGKLRGGEHFSILHPTAGWRLYRVVEVYVDSPSAGYTTVTIRPPLREAVQPATALEFDSPRCVMQLADPRAMDLTREMRKRGSPSVTFIEAFP